MQIDPSDRDEFRKTFHLLLAAASEFATVTQEIMHKKDSVAVLFARIAELSDVTSDDAIQAWSAAKSGAVADGMDDLAGTYERMVLALRGQSKAMRETGLLAEQIIAKAKAQESAS